MKNRIGSTKINRIGSTKRTYRKEQIFASNYLMFLKIYFILRTSYKELIWCTNFPNIFIHIFCKRCSFIWRCFFCTSILEDHIGLYYEKMRNCCKFLHGNVRLFFPLLMGRCKVVQLPIELQIPKWKIVFLSLFSENIVQLSSISENWHISHKERLRDCLTWYGEMNKIHLYLLTLWKLLKFISIS